MSAHPRMADLVTQAVRELGGTETPVSNHAIQEWVRKRYPDANLTTISCTMMLCSVNVQSRVHYAENQKVRMRQHPGYDTLYKVGRAQYVLFDPNAHGRWGITRKDGKFAVMRIQDTQNVVERSAGTIRDKVKEAQLEIGALIAAGGSAEDPKVSEQKRLIERLTLDLNDLEGKSRPVLSDSDNALLMEMFDLARKALPDHGEFDNLQQKEQELWEMVKRLRA